MTKSLKHMAIRGLQLPLIILDCILFVFFLIFTLTLELLEDFDD